ncbi:hypothetical protein MRB53_014027 [Persea americana]|uniref:Uncharacterized protein n=1 Tax=Persea americana TaxID=3435 RepID=A0ACC2KA12_PERAE|nr:hypothetical protein MRB53_014027 [Persea americana]
MRRKTMATYRQCSSTERKLQSGAEEEESQDEGDTLIYKDLKASFRLSKNHLYEASPRATLMSLRSDCVMVKEATRGTNNTFPGDY